MKLRVSNSMLLAATVVAIVSYIAVFEGGVLSSSYTADSVEYMRMAENIKAGHLMNNNGIAGGKGWFAAWPIGYPLTLAAISKVTGLDVFWASKIVSILCAVTMLILFLRNVKDSFPILALTLLNLAYLKISRSSLSEPLFMVLLVGLGFVGAHLSNKVGSRIDWRSAIVLFFLFVGLFLVRYVGFFAPIWLGVTVVVCRFGRGVVGTVAVAGVGAWVFDILYWMMNKIMCGYVSGFGRALPRETGMELFRMIVEAEIHELQAFGIMAFLVACLWFAGSRLMAKGEGARCNLACKGEDGWLVFVLIGAMYHATIVFMRCRQSFDALGFRLLYPGTLMIVIGVVLLLRHASYFGARDWTRSLNGIPLGRFMVLLICVMLFGCWLLYGELQLRRALGIETYSLGRPYRELREALLVKYGDIPSGTCLKIGCSCCGEEFLIAALRPDLMVETIEQ